MPHITLKMIPGRDEKQKEQIAHALQDFLSDYGHIEMYNISVSIEEIPGNNWNAMMREIPEQTFYIRPGYSIDE